MRGLEKNRMGRGHIYIYTYRQTSRLTDQLGPEGRVGENVLHHFKRIYTVYFYRHKESIEHSYISVRLVLDIRVYNCVTDISTDYKSDIDASLLNQLT